ISSRVIRVSFVSTRAKAPRRAAFWTRSRGKVPSSRSKHSMRTASPAASFVEWEIKISASSSQRGSGMFEGSGGAIWGDGTGPDYEGSIRLAQPDASSNSRRDQPQDLVEAVDQE